MADNSNENQAREAETNSLAITGFVLSFFLAFIGSILCIISLPRIKEKKQKGRGLAIAGIIIGFLHPLFITILVGIIWTIIQGFIGA